MRPGGGERELQLMKKIEEGKQKKLYLMCVLLYVCHLIMFLYFSCLLSRYYCVINVLNMILFYLNINKII